jgi:hypothetical protein
MLRKTLWVLTKKYKFLRPIYFQLIRIKNLFALNKGYWVNSPNDLKKLFESISNTNYVLLSKEQEQIVEISIEYNKDIDLLVADNDINLIKSKLVHGRPGSNSIRVDIYSTTGLYPHTFNGIAIIPPLTASSILKSLQIKNNIKVLSENDKLLFYNYKKLYLRGECNQSEDVYLELLEKYKHIATIGIRETDDFRHIEKVDYILGSLGWRPALDMLEILASNSDCLKRLVEREYKTFQTDRQFVMFVLRETNELSLIKEMVNDELSHNAKILDSGEINGLKLENFVINTRGGNWISNSVNVGNEPRFYYFCEYKKMNSDYAELKRLKFKIREAFHKNVIHSSDSSRQALYYLSLLNENWMDFK